MTVSGCSVGAIVMWSTSGPPRPRGATFAPGAVAPAAPGTIAVGGGERPGAVAALA
ncbi:hypothetical protein PUR61_03190 [Streptomyces sp. BE20]|uniref:hypothetical protein n=1 Tax=Streptomyces sp. BE20 TaxID=3002525 RepID=UPI002E77A4A2|nr:hypothetical protein [Streptomyces sp. BE20]MEE1821207.1 hypothetical protein [Streptomyces sp. BE20]